MADNSYRTLTILVSQMVENRSVAIDEMVQKIIACEFSGLHSSYVTLKNEEEDI